jgi:hypothetical protein
VNKENLLKRYESAKWYAQHFRHWEEMDAFIKELHGLVAEPTHPKQPERPEPTYDV